MKVYRWTIEGTEEQQLETKAALERITFSFKRLTIPFKKPAIVFRKQESAGLFHPGTGQITISSDLPTDAIKNAISFEFAHLVDFHMPMTEGMHKKIIKMVGGVEWLTSDFANNVGETWMFLFAAAFVDPRYIIENSTKWKIDASMIPEVYRILKVDPVKAPQ